VQLADIDYELPDELIAQRPVEPRDAARLLVALETAVEHKTVSDICEFIQEGDVVVVNETRVLASRIALKRNSGGRVEMLLLEARDDGNQEWEALIRPGRKMRAGEVLLTESGLPFAEVKGRSDAGDTFVIRILRGTNAADRLSVINEFGSMPLPHYITASLDDKERYQTVFSRDPKSAAAPTAGLHFTPELLEQVKEKGAKVVVVELVVGLDTFKPVEADNPLDHVIHSESYNVPQETWDAVNEAKRVIAVGTTSVRALESAATFEELSGRTKLFITPGYEWKVVDVMMTNFHMPRTTLLLMVQSFYGEEWRNLYALAKNERYRFLSFGDAMLLARHGGALIKGSSHVSG
jgi:S-adenosylmethionine:tRNA ribosyltransferase-isomerase